MACAWIHADICHQGDAICFKNIITNLSHIIGTRGFQDSTVRSPSSMIAPGRNGISLPVKEYLGCTLGSNNYNKKTRRFYHLSLGSSLRARTGPFPKQRLVIRPIPF